MLTEYPATSPEESTAPAEYRRRRRLWTADLRSGRYPQGKFKLHRSVPGGGRFCCLGVACQTYLRESGQTLEVHEEHRYYAYNGSHATLPQDVARWFGLRETAGVYKNQEDIGPVYTSLTIRNDSGATFAAIADLIDSEPEELFVL